VGVTREDEADAISNPLAFGCQSGAPDARGLTTRYGGVTKESACWGGAAAQVIMPPAPQTIRDFSSKVSEPPPS